MEEQQADDRERYRREAMGAFAHEIRTPLTSMKMILELARRQSENGDLVLDEELAKMLLVSVDAIEQLANDLQETSQLERGKLRLSSGPCSASEAIRKAQRLLGESILIKTDAQFQVEGPWDPGRTARAFAGFAATANLVGDGTGKVHVSGSVIGAWLRLEFRSGDPREATKPVAADAGYPFFRSRQFVLASGGTVECRRGERCVSIMVALPFAISEAS